MDWIARLKQETKSLIHPVPGSRDLDQMEQKYLSSLARFWSLDDDPAATMDEARRLVDRLDELYCELHHQGRRVPARLPVERNRDQVQKEMAL